MSDALQILETRTGWQQATPAQQDEAVAAVLADLGDAYSHVRTASYEAGGAAHRIATLRHEPSEIELQLLPGGRVRCGALEERTFEQVENWWSEDRLDFTYDRALVRNAQVTPFLLGRRPLKAPEWRALGGPDEAFALPAWSTCQSQLAETPFQLPTEAQWEYGCRSGTTTRYFWGDDFDPSFAHCEAEAASLEEPQPNAFGLVGVLGAMWEWTADEYVSTFRSKLDDEPGQERYHMLRGGSWRTASDRCRCASFREIPAEGLAAQELVPAEVGLRVVLPLVRPYSPQRSFLPAETLHHPTHGRGVVRHMNQREIEVEFADGVIHRLVHGQAGA